MESEALHLEYADSVCALPKAPADPRLPKQRAAFIDGFSLHAGVHLHANDREGLEHLCCYGARGPLSLQRLSLTPDGRVCYAHRVFAQPFDNRSRDGMASVQAAALAAMHAGDQSRCMAWRTVAYRGSSRRLRMS